MQESVGRLSGSPRLSLLSFARYVKLCAYCAGTSGVDGTIDEAHTLEWKSVLPICPTCLAGGARPLVRARRRNGEVHERRAQRAHLLNSRASQVADEGGARG